MFYFTFISFYLRNVMFYKKNMKSSININFFQLHAITKYMMLSHSKLFSSYTVNDLKHNFTIKHTLSIRMKNNKISVYKTFKLKKIYLKFFRIFLATDRWKQYLIRSTIHLCNNRPHNNQINIFIKSNNALQ